MFLIWNKLNKKVEVLNKKSFFIVLALLFTTFIFFIYQIDIGFAINYILLCTMVIVVFRLPIKEVVLEFVIILIISATLQLLCIYIFSWFMGSQDVSFIDAFIINSSIFLFTIFINKFINFNIVYEYILKYKGYITSIIFNIAGVVMLLLYVWRTNENIVRQYIIYVLIAFFLWEGINIFFLYQNIRIKEQKKIINVHDRYEPFLKGMIYEVRQKQHDFKNHLHTLYGLVQLEDDKEAKNRIQEYLESVIESIKPTDKLLNIKDPILNAIIYSKKALAEEKNILFELNFQGEIPEYPIEKYELVELLGNLLDNAIEAAEDVDATEISRVALTIGTEENEKFIIVKNTGGTLRNSDIDIHKIFKSGFSTKQGKSRGYGLYNVKRIVDHYKGHIQLSFENEYTVFQILFK